MDKKRQVMLAILLLILIVPVSVGLRNTRLNSGIREREIASAFGFESIMADILWLRAIQFLGTVYVRPGTTGISQKDIVQIYTLFDRIVTLDPKFTPAYEYGGLALSVCAPDLSLDLLERGISHNTEAGWKLPFYAGMVANQWMKDPVRAYAYLSKAQTFSDRPAYVDRFLARTASHSGDLKTALDVWKAIYKDAADQLERGIAARGLNAIADKVLEESADRMLRQEAQWAKESI